MIRLMIAWHNACWWAEKQSGRIWDRVSGSRVSCWIDPLPAFFLRLRASAQNRINRRGYTVYGRIIE